MNKKVILLLLIIGITTASFSQKKRDQIKAYKTAYITEVLDLSVKEAEQFWPIYNEFSKKEHQLKRVEIRKIRKKIRAAGGIDTFSDLEATKILANLIQIENDIHIAKTKMLTELKKVLSSKKIIKLHRAEQDFNRKLLNRFKEKRFKK